MNKTTFVDDRTMRDQFAGRVEVLDRVKKLLLLPKLDMMTSQQVADYYEVPYETLKGCYKRNCDEIDQDGAVIRKPDFWKSNYPTIKDSTRGSVTFQIDANTTIVIPNAGIRLFSKRAILRIGMLLRDSAVAKEVRTQLLNIVERTTDKKHTKGHEDTLLINGFDWVPVVLDYPQMEQQIRFILMDTELWTNAADFCVAIGLQNSSTIVRKCDKRDIVKLLYSQRAVKAFTDAGSKVTSFCPLGIRFVAERGIRAILAHFNSSLSESFEQWYNETAKPKIQKRIDAIKQAEERQKLAEAEQQYATYDNTTSENESARGNQPENRGLLMMSQNRGVIININKMELVEVVGRNIVAHCDVHHGPIFLGTYGCEEDARTVQGQIFDALSKNDPVYKMPPE